MGCFLAWGAFCITLLKKVLYFIKFLNLRALKKLAAILLMGILCFNWCGYRLLSSYLEERADRNLEASLDNNNYDGSQLITIKIASTHLSYYNSSTQFERVDGQIEIGGVWYKYVERRLFNDSLELRCIPNHAAMRLQTARNEFFQLVNDLQHNGQSKKSGSHPVASRNFSAVDFYIGTDPFKLEDPVITLLLTWPHNTPAIPSTYSLTDEQPPDQHTMAFCRPSVC